MSVPESVDVHELGRNASRYVATAMQGKRIPITEQGKVVAYLVPATTFERMVAAGQVRPAKGSLTDTLATLDPLEAMPGEKTLSETLQEMRDEERY